jgi:integrase
MARREPCFRLTKLKENPGRDRVLSEDEISNLLSACRQSKSPYLYCYVLMSLTTGARQGEILGLEWRHVDFENKLAYLKETKNGRLEASLLLIPSLLSCCNYTKSETPQNHLSLQVKQPSARLTSRKLGKGL